MKHKYNLKLLGERILQERTAKGMTQDAMMNALRDVDIPLSRSSLYKIEHGERCDALTIEMLFALCDLFDCDMGYLLCEEGYEERTRKATDVVNATGLTPEAVHKLIAWNQPVEVHTGDVEQAVKMNAYTERIQALSRLITDSRFCGALSGYLYCPEAIGTVYTHDSKGTHFSHSPSFIVMDNIQVDSSLIEQALLNTVTDAIKDMRKEVRKEG